MPRDGGFDRGYQNPEVPAVFPKTHVVAVLAQNEYQMSFGGLINILADVLPENVDTFGGFGFEHEDEFKIPVPQNTMHYIAKQLLSEEIPEELFMIRTTEDQYEMVGDLPSNIGPKYYTLQDALFRKVPAKMEDYIVLTDAGYDALEAGGEDTWNPELLLREIYKPETPDLYEPEEKDFEKEIPIADMDQFSDEHHTDHDGKKLPIYV